MKIEECLLRQHRFLQELDEEHIRYLTGCASSERFAAGEYLLRQGDVADHFYLLLQGRVVLEAETPGHEVVELEHLGKDDVLGWSWLFPPARWQLSARVVEPVFALVFDGHRLRAKMEYDSELGYAVAKLMLYEIYQRLMRVRQQRLREVAPAHVEPEPRSPTP